MWQKAKGDRPQVNTAESKQTKEQTKHTWSQFKKPKAYAMGSHMRRMEPSEPPWLLNQSVKLTLSKARTLRMPPSGSTRALTMGDVPKAKELAACTYHKHVLVDAQTSIQLADCKACSCVGASFASFEATQCASVCMNGRRPQQDRMEISKRFQSHLER